MMTFRTEAAARDHARRSVETLVLVDGPGDGEITVMPLADAIEEGFAYTFVAAEVSW